MSGVPEAVGAAASIIQLIDFAFKLVNTASRINDSASGTTQESDDFEVAANNLDEAKKQVDLQSGTLNDQKLVEICN